MTVEISYYDCEACFVVPMQGVEMVQVVVCTWSVQQEVVPL